ncbi:MAG: right-handed parallel beta-helix repeat-containing protein [Planctomycetes bacterium]|nr:right-handed parallel beta-helix repeat-containing protein [Planctomycetota bacterium]
MIRSRALFVSLALSLLALSAGAGTRYVDAALASGANDGSSWTNAYQGSNGLQLALTAAVSGDEIWVAQGSYEPTAGATRSIYFQLRNGVAIYGGFAGGELTLDQRDVAAHVAILTADLNGDDGTTGFAENSYHVVDASGTNATAVLDGFTVRGGNANLGSANQDRGGGILCVGGASPTVRNCIFRENRCTFGGGAGYINASAPSFTDCRFENNLGSNFGGAFDMATNVTASFTRCVFSGNSAARAGGVEIFGSSTVKLTNCVFRNNTSTGSGGGGAIFISSSSPVIRNCTIVGNHSTVNATAGILASPLFAASNNLIYFNDGPGGAQNLVNNMSGVSCTYSCVQGGAAGTGNVSADPQLANLGSGDVHLGPLSPCADAGSNPAVPVGTTTDLEGNPRFADAPGVPDTGLGSSPLVDIGAYELQNTLYTLFCAGDGSLATPCPCGNTAPTGHGCLNSDFFSQGALLLAAGSATPDTVVLTSSEMIASASCIFLQGNQQNASGAVFGDGVRCVAGTLKRLYTKSASGGVASAPGVGDPSISARSASLGDTIAPGSQRFYQVYYRDPAPSFCPSPQGNTWNISSGVILNW